MALSWLNEGAMAAARPAASSVPEESCAGAGGISSTVFNSTFLCGASIRMSSVTTMDCIISMSSEGHAVERFCKQVVVVIEVASSKSFSAKDSS